MAQNLFVPLYQDESGVGKLVSFVIRFTWIWVGGMVSTVVSLPILLVAIIYALLPLIAILMSGVGILNVIMNST